MIEVAPELLNFLREEEERGRNEELLLRAETALNSYNGDYYGDEIDGRSKVVARDVSEVIDHMNVSVLRTFVSGDRVVEFEPDSEELEQAADDATEAIQRQFARKGYSLLHDWLKEGNISTLGIVKAAVERRKQREEFYSIDPEADGAIEADIDEEASAAAGGEVFRAVRLAETPAEFKDYLVPLEEFRISPDARDPDEALYVAHASPKFASELVEMGLCTAEEAEDLNDERSADTLSYARDNGLEDWQNDRKGANKRVILLEEYVRFDADGDGIAERLCVHRVGNTVLRIEPCDYQPFVIYCPFPMPGRLAGHSLADKVTDIQRVNTALMRLSLDGLYRNLAPRTYVPDDAVNENTYDDLLNVVPGGLIRFKGATPPTPEVKNDVSATAFQAIEFMIGQRESRTGITRLNQGLDADALNKTATGTALMQAQGQQMEEYLARNFAESVARLMRLKLKMMARYGQPMQMRVDGEFRQIDPGQWPEDMEVVIRVGLGSGRKEQRLQNRMMLLQIQREVMMAGLPIVGPEQLYKSIAGVVKDASIGSPSDFVVDPTTIQPELDENGQPVPPPPSPEEQKLQAETQLAAAKMQGEQQMQAMKLQSDQQAQAMKIEAMREEAALKAQLARDEATAAAQLAREKAEFEAQLARAKFDAELQMERERMDMQAEIAARDAQRRDAEADAKISQNRAGGDLAK